MPMADSTSVFRLWSAVYVAVLVCVPALAVHAMAEKATVVGINPASVIAARGESEVIVIGFLGGFVDRQDSNHLEVQLIRTLRQQYPTGVYFGLFENDSVDEAKRAILKQLDLQDDSPLTKESRPRARIILFGHSWGASAVVRLARMLDRDEIPVALTVQVDSVAKPFSNDRLIPGNVRQAVNFYQTRGLIHGRSTITAADPTRTTILGNFRRDYKREPAPCRNFSWYSRLFTKGHIEIECDPSLWLEVQTLFSPYLSDTSSRQSRLEPFELEAPSPIIGLGMFGRTKSLHFEQSRSESNNGYCCK